MRKVFVVHGWAYSLDKWSGLAEQLQERDIEPVLLKVPGLTEPSEKVWDIEGYSDWLAGQLKGVKKPVVIGHSNGGRIAMHYATRHQGKLGRLILIDSAGVPHNELKPRTKLRILRLLAYLGRPVRHVPWLRRAFYKVIGARDYYEAPDNMKKTMQNMLHADNMIDYDRIDVPVDIIWGRQDTVTPLEDGLKLAELLKNPPLHIVDGARHSPMATHPGRVADLIVAILEEKH